MVIDDDQSMVEVLTHLLRHEGYKVEGFTDPVVAFERLCAGPGVNLVLADCVMPRMSGGELLEAMEERGISTPVVLMTALSDPNFCVAPGRVTVLSKPFVAEDLLAEVAAQLSPRKRSSIPAPMAGAPPEVKPPKAAFWRW